MTGYEIVYLIALVLVTVLARPKTTTPRPAVLEDFELPIPDEGTPQCVIFGDCWSQDWEVLSYGNLRTTKIKTKSGK